MEWNQALVTHTDRKRLVKVDGPLSHPCTTLQDVLLLLYWEGERGRPHFEARFQGAFLWVGQSENQVHPSKHFFLRGLYVYSSSFLLSAIFKYPRWPRPSVLLSLYSLVDGSSRNLTGITVPLICLGVLSYLGALLHHLHLGERTAEFV